MRRLLMLLVIFPWLASSAGAGEKLVLGHRGASGFAPEHTLVSYALAHAEGADFVELDVVLTKDRVFLCLHDLELDRTTDVAQVFPDRKREDGRWYAADFTLEEIRRLNVHERTDETGAPVFPNRFPLGKSRFQVPTLEETIELVQGLNRSTGRGVGLYVELKSPAWHTDEGLPLEEALLAVLDRYGYRDADSKIFVQCFDPRSLIRLRALGTTLRLVQLIEDPQADERFAPLITEAGIQMIATYANGYGPWKKLVQDNPELVRWCHEAGLVVHPYTFRADRLEPPDESFEEELRRFLFDFGVDGVFTDFPGLAVRFLQKR